MIQNGFRDEGQCDRTSGMVSVRVSQSADETVERLKSVVSAHGGKIFAVIDHAREARAAGLEMPPTTVVIFGNPRSGTPLMRASPSIAIDLPLKVLIAEDGNGDVSLSYVAPQCLQLRHDLPQRFVDTLEVVEKIVAAVQAEATAETAR